MAIVAGQTAAAADVKAIKDDVDAIISASSSTVATSESTASTTFGNLATTGPQVTITTGTAVLVHVYCLMSNDTAGGAGNMGVSVSGATSSSANVSRSLSYESSNANDAIRAGALFLMTGLTAGSNTFTAAYRVNSGTGTFADRELLVIPLGD